MLIKEYTKGPHLSRVYDQRYNFRVELYEDQRHIGSHQFSDRYIALSFAKNWTEK